MDAETKSPAIYTPPGVPDSRMYLAVRKALRILLVGLAVSSVLLLMGVWSAMAIYFPSDSHQTFRTILACAFVVGFVAAFVFIRNRLQTSLCVVGAFAAVLTWWSALSPTHDRDWSPLAQRLPIATREGDKVTIRDIRNFEYRSATDFTPRYYDETFDLSKIATVDFLICYWGTNERTAHSMLSFGFSDGKYLCLSVEARPERGEAYTGIGGLFKKFELIYVLGDELDLIRSRTNFRNERVFLYPIASDHDHIRTLFEKIIERVQAIRAKPEFYNTLTHNCTTNLVDSGREILPPNPFDIRILLNGYADRMAYDNRWIKTEDSFEDTRERHCVNQYVKDKPDAANFSRLIRPHLSDD